MLAHPEDWGGPEAYELQVLLLIEIEILLTEKLSEPDSLRLVLDRYSTFLRRELPARGARSLSTVIDDCARFSEYLAGFRRTSEDEALRRRREYRLAVLDNLERVEAVIPEELCK